MNLNEILAQLTSLSPEAQGELTKVALDSTKSMKWVPNPGPQIEAYFSEADEIFYGGQAGGGKTDLEIGLAITAHQNSLILRRTNKEVDGLVERMASILGTRDGWSAQHGMWRISDGRLVELGGCQLEEDKQKRKGHPKDLYCFDEVSDFTESQYTFIIGWNRSVDINQRCRIVAAGNPPTQPEGLWVLKRWGAWLDPTHPNPAQYGELRWYTTGDDGKEVEVDGRGPHIVNDEEVYARSRTFIPAKLSDNPDLAATNYGATLDGLPAEYRAAYRDGSFTAGLADNAFQTIPTSWVREAQKRWKSVPPVNVPMCAIGVDVAQGGCFDDKTEILTDDGWKLFSALTGAEKVLTLDGEIAKWGGITHLHAYPFKGELNVYEPARGINFAITDNHNLLAKSPKATAYSVQRYDALPRYFNSKRTNTWVGSTPVTKSFKTSLIMPNGGSRDKEYSFTFEDWARFLGWFVSEGCTFKEVRANGRWRINISQNKGYKYDRIGVLLKRMGLVARETKSRSGWELSNNTIGEWLAVNCGVHAANKKIPREIKEAPPEVLEAFLEEYRLGDGSINRGGTSSYTTTSKLLVDDIQEVLSKLGRCGKAKCVHLAGSEFSIGNRKVIRKKDCYTVTETQGREAYIDKEKVQRVPYEGLVYCVSTPLKTIMVRRGGSTMWSGNSDNTVLAIRYDGWYAPLKVVAGKLTPDGKTVAGLVITSRRDSAKVIIDIGGGWGGDAYAHLKENGIDTASYMGVKQSNRRTVDKQITFFNVRAEAYWRFREALDPSQEQGSPIMLPEDPELVADLCAPSYKIGPNGIQVEPKADLVKRLGRSPDKGDAVVMAWWDGLKQANVQGGWKNKHSVPKVNLGRVGRK